MTQAGLGEAAARIDAGLDEAATRIEAGGLVAYPTETLFGLAADATCASAVARLCAWKGRNPDDPLAILVEGPAALGPVGVRLPAAARRLARALWPGPLTLVLPCDRDLPEGVARVPDGAVGVRCSSHPVAAALARRLAERGVGPVTATSLNRSGERPAARRSDALALCGTASDAPWLLDVAGAPEPDGAPSTVVDATAGLPRVLREGAVSRARIEACLAAQEEA